MKYNSKFKLRENESFDAYLIDYARYGSFLNDLKVVFKEERESLRRAVLKKADPFWV